MIKDIVNTQDEGKVHMIPISNELKQAGQHVYQAYNERLRDEREGSKTKRKGEERSRKARRGNKTIGGSREEFKRQKKDIR